MKINLDQPSYSWEAILEILEPIERQGIGSAGWPAVCDTCDAIRDELKRDTEWISL